MLFTPTTTVSRRRFLTHTACAAAAAWLVNPRNLFAKEGGIVDAMRSGAAKAKITVEKLRGNISVIIGSGGNIAVLAGGDGKLLIDAGMTGSRPRITDALAGIGPQPIKHLINTHWHFDHTDGNEWLHAAGATIIAHENTRKRLSQPTRVDAWDFTFEPSPMGALPSVIVKAEHKLDLSGTAVAIEHYPPPCHTDTDLVVHFPGADILHTGDTFWNGHYPFIDYSTGGSIDGMIKATQSNLAKVTPKSIIIPGHGPVADRASLTEFRDMLTDIREKVAVSKKQGKSVDEVTAAKPTSKYDEKWGTFVIDPGTFVKLVYAGV